MSKSTVSPKVIEQAKREAMAAKAAAALGVPIAESKPAEPAPTAVAAALQQAEEKGGLYYQTDKLGDALPLLRQVFEAANQRGAHEWRVVRWFCPLAEAGLDNFKEISWKEGGKIALNSFQSRTKALRKSASFMRKGGKYAGYASEKGHWAVWHIKTGSEEFFQAVLPFARSGNVTGSEAVKPVIVDKAGKLDEAAVKSAEVAQEAIAVSGE